MLSDPAREPFGDDAGPARDLEQPHPPADGDAPRQIIRVVMEEDGPEVLTSALNRRRYFLPDASSSMKKSYITEPGFHFASAFDDAYGVWR